MKIINKQYNEFEKTKKGRLGIDFNDLEIVIANNLEGVTFVEVYCGENGITFPYGERRDNVLKAIISHNDNQYLKTESSDSCDKAEALSDEIYDLLVKMKVDCESEMKTSKSCEFLDIYLEVTKYESDEKWSALLSYGYNETILTSYVEDLESKYLINSFILDYLKTF